MVTVARRAVCVAAGVMMLFVAGPPVGARQNTQKQVLVTVMNARTGQPAAGVTAADLSVKEDGAAREIVKVEPATSPMAVVLLADNTGAFVRYANELKATARGFLSTFMAAHAGSSAALWTFAGAPNAETKFLTDAAKLDDEAGKLRPRDVAAAATASDREASLLYGVAEAAKELGKRPETRRVIVSFNAVTPLENSKLTKQQVYNELVKANVTWFAVTFADGGTSSSMRDNVMVEVLPYSGGFRATVQEAGKLEAAMKSLADVLNGQYLVTYTRPSGSAKEVQVDVKGDGLRAFFPHWAPK